MAMTKEEFLMGVRRMVSDMADPDGEYVLMVSEGAQIASEMQQFDPVMATKMLAITDAIAALGDYVRSRGEFLGDDTGDR
jgi:hypothetical protein